MPASDEEAAPQAAPWPAKRASGAHLGEVLEPDKDSQSTSAMPEFDSFPEHLRVGPWSWRAVAYLCCFGAWLMWSAQDAFVSYPRVEVLSAGTAGTRLRVLRGSVAVYCSVVIMVAWRSYGRWPFASYTMVAYVLLALRLACGLFGWAHLAETLRFPVLVMAWVTTTVWWLVLVPVIYTLMPGGKEARRRFLRFNFSMFLLNVHLLNLPIAMLDHYSSWRSLCLWDLWMAMLIAFLYVLFYLHFLDANGVHFYIILSPRPWWCVYVYTGILFVYIGIYCAFG